MKRFQVMWFIMLGLLCTISVAQAGSVNLEYKYKLSEGCKYKITMSITTGLPGSDRIYTANINGDIAEKVIGIKKDGSIELAIMLKNMKASYKLIQDVGNIRSIPDKTYIITIAKSGKIVSKNNDSSSSLDKVTGGFDLMGSSIHGVVLPEEAVSVGQSWDNKSSILNGVAEVNAKSTLLSDSEQVGDQTAAKIKNLLDAKLDIATVLAAIEKEKDFNKYYNDALKDIKGTIGVAGTTVYYFSPLQGKLLKSEGNYKINSSISFPKTKEYKQLPASMNVTYDITITVTKQ
ncbi:MAG: hypothetical protein ABFD46_03720 [Armatimonadota bacterium]